MALPSLVYSPKTKTNNDAWIYYHTDIGIRTKTKWKTASGVTTRLWTSCASTRSCTGTSLTATFLPKGNTAAIGGIPASSPVGTAAIGDLDPVTTDDFVHVACIPDFDEATLLCFDQGFSSTPGLSQRPIPVKHDPADHYVYQRPENSITVSDLFVSNFYGLQAIKGRPCTLIVAITPDGSGVFQEVQYYCNVVLNPQPMNTGADGNASIEISMDGSYSFVCIFSATPP